MPTLSSHPYAGATLGVAPVDFFDKLLKGTAMTQRLDPTKMNGTNPMNTVRGVRDVVLDSWSRSMIQLVNTDTYTQLTNMMLDSYLTLTAPYRQLLTSTMNQTLAMLNMPNRQEVTGLGERLMNIEVRLDDLDARLDSIDRNVKALARVTAAPAAPLSITASQRDRLTEIGGIGKAYEQKLQAAGIATYAALAAATPEQVRAALGTIRVGDVNVEAWIEQARQIVSGAPVNGAGKAQE